MVDRDDAAEAFGTLIATRVGDRGRLAAVAASGLLDTPAETGFDRIASIACRALGTANGFVTVVDAERSFWKACVGLEGTDPGDPADRAKRQHRVEESFCQYVIGLDDVLLVDDARLDPRTMHNPLIESMGVVAWAGAPMRAPGGEVVGTVCVVDTRARSWTEDDGALLRTLADIATDEISSARAVRAASRSETLLASVLARAPIGFALFDDELRYEMINETLAKINGIEAREHLGRTIVEVLPYVADEVTPLLRSVLDTGEPVTGIEIVGSTPAQLGVERSWSTSFYRIELGAEKRAGVFVEEITELSQARRRAALLASISAALAKADTLDDVTSVLTGEISEYFAADVAVIGHWSPDARSATILGEPAVRDAIDPASLNSDDDAPYAEAVRTGRVVTVSDAADRRARYASVVGSALTAEAVAPCITGDGTFTGVLVIGWTRRVEPDEFPVPQLQTVSALIASAFERQHLSHQRRELIAALRETLLNDPPRRPGMEVAVRYRPAGDVFGFGGDWYDVIAIDDARTALIVGDVVGHDPVAAAHMSQIASIVAQLLMADTPLADVFTEVERSMAARSVTTMATVGIVVVDTAERTLTPISAGHLPALIIGPDGDSSLMEPGLRPPLWQHELAVDVEPIVYQPGTRLVMFTDGLVETRDGTIDDDLDRLVRHVDEIGRVGIDELLDSLLDGFAAGPDGRDHPDHPGHVDDIALLGAHLD